MVLLEKTKGKTISPISSTKKHVPVGISTGISIRGARRALKRLNQPSEGSTTKLTQLSFAPLLPFIHRPKALRPKTDDLSPRTKISILQITQLGEDYGLKRPPFAPPPTSDIEVQ